MTHSEAILMVRGKRNANRRKVGNNTYAEILHDGSVGIMLHSTYVVKIHPNNTYTLQTGGWNTPTTKDRINQYFPGYVRQRKGEWYVSVTCSDGCKNEFPFIESMVVQG